MKKLLITLCLAPAIAYCGNWYSYRMGNFDYYHNNESGNSYWGNQIGNQYRVWGTDGYSGYGYRLGRYHFWEDND